MPARVGAYPGELANGTCKKFIGTAEEVTCSTTCMCQWDEGLMEWLIIAPACVDPQNETSPFMVNLGRDPLNFDKDMVE